VVRQVYGYPKKRGISAESGLRRFEHQKLKMFTTIVDWHTPFAIVILDQKRIVHADPGTSFRSHKPHAADSRRRTSIFVNRTFQVSDSLRAGQVIALPIMLRTLSAWLSGVFPLNEILVTIDDERGLILR
jgi:hypothetical protein